MASLSGKRSIPFCVTFGQFQKTLFSITFRRPVAWFSHFGCSFNHQLLTRKQFSQSVYIFYANTKDSIFYGYNCNKVSWSSFSHLESKLSISRKLMFSFKSIFFCMENAMLQIQICFPSLVSSNKSDLLNILDFYRLNWKSQTSFVLSFSKIFLFPIVLCTTLF